MVVGGGEKKDEDGRRRTTVPSNLDFLDVFSLLRSLNFRLICDNRSQTFTMRNENIVLE